jgi:predicted MFS family arabinose efflux permease
MMQELAGFSPSTVSWILLGCISVAIGNVWGGKLADKHGAVAALKFIFAALVVCCWCSSLPPVSSMLRWQRCW